MAPIISDNSIESGCEFVDNSNTTTTINSNTNSTINSSYFSETNVESSNEDNINNLDNESFENVASGAEEESCVVNDQVLNVSSVCEEEVVNELNEENDSNEQQQQQKQRMPWEAPGKQGLYDPQNEHEACGVGFIVAIDGKRSHKVSLSLNSNETHNAKKTK